MSATTSSWPDSWAFRFIRKHIILSRPSTSLISGIVNHFGTQSLRLVGNLVLTRLLYPEVFGLMALVNVFLIGLDMLSDVGITQSIIRKKGDLTESFLQSAWTLQLIRGVVLFVGTLLLAFPLAQFFGKPEVAYLLPLLGGTRLLIGFRSIAIPLQEKELKPHYHVILHVSCTAIGILSSIVATQFFHGALALVAGAYVSAIVYTLGSFRIKGFHSHRVHWDKESVREIQHFGKWILCSTAVSFLAMQGDRIIMGKLLDAENLALYVLAAFYVQVFTGFISSIGSNSLTPIYARAVSQNTSLKLRRVLVLISTLAFFFLYNFGDDLIHLLYDTRYHKSGSYLSVISLSIPVLVLRALNAPWLIVDGNSFGRFLLSFFEAIILLLTGCLGWGYGGLEGYIFGVVIGQYLLLPVSTYIIGSKSLLDWKLDGCFLGLCALMVLFSRAV